MLPENAAWATTGSDKTTWLDTLNWARQGQAIDTSTCHMGFRCVLRDAGSGPG